MANKDVLLDREDPQNKNVNSKFSLEDLFWLYSRAGSTIEDVDIDGDGRKYFKDYPLPISGLSVESLWGRTYLPVKYLSKVTDTPALKFDVKTGQFYELK